VVAQDTRTTLSNVLAGVWADNARRRRFSLATLLCWFSAMHTWPQA